LKLPAPAIQPLHSPGFRRQAQEILGGSRKIGPGLISDLITEYNDSQAKEVTPNAIISVAESKAIHFLANCSPAVLREIKLAWSLNKDPSSPALLLRTSFLDDMTVPCKYAPNDVWHQILKPSELKFVTFFRKSRLCFEDCHEKNQDLEMVWRMSCLWVAAHPTLVRMCSQQAGI
jgi:hypothetical protein